MVAQEQACCAFLVFTIEESPDSVDVTITAPERAREIACELFAVFPGARAGVPFALAPTPSVPPSIRKRRDNGARGAGQGRVTFGDAFERKTGFRAKRRALPSSSRGRV